MKIFSPLSFRLRVLRWVALLVFVTALPSLAIAGSVKLKSAIDVDEDFVTLGDLFSNVAHGADHVVSRAPAPGKLLELDYKTLKRIANSFKLDWQPQSQLVRATVRRDATQISLEHIKQSIHDEIIARQAIQSRSGIAHTVKLERAPSSFYAPSKAVPDIQFADLHYDEKTGRFQADVALYEGSGITRLRGEFFATIEIPVPLHSISKGETITASDLHLITMRKNSVPPNVQTDINKVIGKSPKRILRADSTIAIQYLQEPLLVKRQRLVSVVYAVKNLVLTTKGMAMSDGSLGQVVQVKNLKSNRIIDSVVTGSDEVSVSFAGDSLLNNL